MQRLEVFSPGRKPGTVSQRCQVQMQRKVKIGCAAENAEVASVFWQRIFRIFCSTWKSPRGGGETRPGGTSTAVWLQRLGLPPLPRHCCVPSVRPSLWLPGPRLEPFAMERLRLQLLFTLRFLKNHIGTFEYSNL
ncbi:transmembrane protein 263 isoform X2 [Candoia aspera]